MNRELKVTRLVNSLFNEPFVWGKLDCTLFVLKCVDVQKGTNFYEKYKGKWKDFKSACKYSLKNKISPESIVRSTGAEEVQYGFHRCGDIFVLGKELCRYKKWESPAVCLGRKLAIMTIECGIIIAPISYATDVSVILRV